MVSAAELVGKGIHRLRNADALLAVSTTVTVSTTFK